MSSVDTIVWIFRSSASRLYCLKCVTAERKTFNLLLHYTHPLENMFPYNCHILKDEILFQSPLSPSVVSNVQLYAGMSHRYTFKWFMF